MPASTESTMLVVSGEQLGSAAVAALRASAERLGHADGCSFATVAELEAFGSVELAIRELDPWSVVAVDAVAIDALRTAFGDASAALAPDATVDVAGYLLVAVPDFAACLDDQQAKRVAWHRLQAAVHPGNPLDI